jgi:hypothetical protein
VIDRHVTPKPTPAPLAEAFGTWPAQKALAALWINPRMLDAELEEKTKQAEGSEAAVLKHLLQYWKALDSIVVSLSVRPDLELTLALRARREALPPTWRRLIEETGRHGALWGHFPGKPLLAVVGRLEAKALCDSVLELLTPEARKGFTETVGRVLSAPLGMDVFEEVLPFLGPEWGAYVGAPAQGEEFPRVILAMQVRPGRKESSVDQALVKGLNFGAMLAVFSYNSSHADQVRLGSLKQGDVEVNYLINDKTFPKGLRPAFALKSGFLVIGSSPEALLSFSAKPSRAGVYERDHPFLRMALTEWATVLKAQRGPWVRAMTADGKMGRAVAEQLADSLLMAMGQFDHLELSQNIQKGQVAWTLRLRPLAK